MFKEIKHEVDKLSFKIEETRPGLANALRRAMIANVQTIAIDTVKIKENNGLLTDEMLAQRLGLIPLKRLDNFVQEVSIVLDVSYDESKAVLGLHTVYSSDLEIESADVELVHKDIIITKLAKGHHIKLYAKAILGCGYTHAKWSPSCGTTYIENDDDTYTFIVESTGAMAPEDIFKGSLEYLREKLQNYIE